MNDGISDLDKWPRTKWRKIISLLFVMQILLAWVLSEKSKPTHLPKHSGPSVSWINNVTYFNPINYYLNLLLNPTLFALPNTNNFSGDAWIKLPPLQFQTSEWIDSVSGIGLNVTNMGISFAQEILGRSPISSVSSDSIKPRYLELLLLNPLPLKESYYSVLGPLDSYSNSLPSHLPSWPYQENFLLSNTIVQVWINDQGNVVSSVLESGCGLKEADQYALNQAKWARFDRKTLWDTNATNQTPTWQSSRIIFYWNTTNTLVTNGF